MPVDYLLRFLFTSTFRHVVCGLKCTNLTSPFYCSTKIMTNAPLSPMWSQPFVQNTQHTLKNYHTFVKKKTAFFLPLSTISLSWSLHLYSHGPLASSSFHMIVISHVIVVRRTPGCKFLCCLILQPIFTFGFYKRTCQMSRIKDMSDEQNLL